MHINQSIEPQDEELLLHPPKTGGRRWVKVTLGIMVILLAAWYFLGGDGQKGSNTEAPDQQGRQNPATGGLAPSRHLIPLVVSEGGSKPSPSPLSTVARKGDKAREFIKTLRGREGEIDLDGIFERAEQFKDEEMLVDAHLMYFFAAKQGHAESALILGSMYDPDHTLEIPNVVEDPSWTQAYKWYVKAADGGNEAARERLKYLRKEVERAAAKGNSEATRLILQWR
uniref:Sel1 repeat-containing protein n=1 Tax=Candidatus Kentrum sp. DK TaxID=2126562 RepID=A0A450SXC9_9GAMM|nr:MAG: hypothetical protein BECKDK2373C_GA0170839_106716 [Candidatus Kentron sp. DK]